MSYSAMRGSIVLHKRAPARITWDKHVEFMLSMIGYCVGFGNVWRFPYRAYKNGGGAFLFPYIFLMFVVGKPLFFLENSLGQFTSRGPLVAFNFIPICRGVGAGMVIISVYFAIYYIMFMVYCTKFIYYSCQPTLPWENCDASWGATNETCYSRKEGKPELWNCSEKGLPADCNKRLQPINQLFWKKVMLHQEDDTSIANIGPIYTDLALLLLLNWVIIYLCLARGIKSSGKVVYFTAIFPYVVLVLMSIYGCTLPGALTGLKYLFIPDFEKILDKTVWMEAITQMFFSLSIGLGGIEVYCSYNDFENKCHRDTFIICMTDFFTSCLSSIAVFTTVGFLANELNMDVANVVDKGPGLMFVVIPEALVLLPLSQLWCVLFFLMVFTLGVDTEFAVIETILTSIKDEIPFSEKYEKHTTSIVLCVCAVFFLLGLPFCTSGGFFVLDFYDSYCIDMGLQYCSLAALVAIMYCYGFREYCDNVHFMLGFHPPWWYWQVCWVVFDPIILLILLVMSVINMPNEDFTGRPYPDWFSPIKWFFALLPILATPTWIIISILQYRNKQGGVRAAFKLNPEWGPDDALTRALYIEWKRQKKQHRAMKPKNFAERFLDRIVKKIRHEPPNEPASEGS